MSIDQFGMWCGRLIHYRTGKTFASPAAPLRDRATGQRHKGTGFTPSTEIEGVAALPVTIRLRASSSRLQQEFPLLYILPARHLHYELRWGYLSLRPCQGRGRARDAPLRQNRAFGRSP